MYTANTMAAAAEAMGMSPGSAARRPSTVAATASPTGPARPWWSAASRHHHRDIITRESLLNAIAVVVALGGSTNAVLHLLAIAHEAHVDLDIEDPPAPVPARGAAKYAKLVGSARYGAVLD